MSQVYELDNVIRLVKDAEVNTGDLHGGKVIRLDANKDEILYKRVFITFNRNIRYYWVSTYNRAESSTECPVKDFSTDKSIVIKMKYEASCPPGNEEKAVLALYKGSNPGATLNDLLNSWVRDFTDDIRRSKNRPVLDFYNYYRELKGTLVEKAARYTGLAIDFLMTLKHEDQLKPEKIASANFPVRIDECEGELNLKYDAGVAVDPKRKIDAILNYDRLHELEKLITRSIQEYVLAHIPLHDFIYHLKDSVKQRLTDMLNDVLQDHGRKIAWLNLDADEAKQPGPETQNIHHMVKCDIKSQDYTIDIHHKLLVQLEDYGKYKKYQTESRSTDDLEKLIKIKLNDITQGVLYDKTYVDILLDFEKEEDNQVILKDIKRDMQQFLISIGYSVKHLMVEPDVEIFVLKRDGFHLVVPEQDYSTRDTRVKIRFEVVARGRLKELKKIQRYIVPNKDVKKEMIDVISNVVQAKMHEIEPEEFYMPDNFPGCELVEGRLRNAIIGKLEEVFYTEDVFVTIKPAENDLIERFQKLKQDSPYLFDIEIFSQLGGGHKEKVLYDIEFYIVNVHKHGWQPFLLRKYGSHEEEVAKIIETLGRDIKDKFQSLPAYVLLGNDMEVKRQLVSTARLSHSKIAVMFGLDIEITLVTRRETELEKANYEVRMEQIEQQKEKEKKMIEIVTEADLDDLQKLRDKKSELIDPDCPDDDALQEVDQRITDLIGKSAHAENAGQNLLKPGETIDENKWSFEMFQDEFKKALPQETAAEENPPEETETGEESSVLQDEDLHEENLNE